MKKILFIITAFLFLTSTVFSQSKININDLVELDGKMYKPLSDKLYSGIVYDSYTGTGEKKLEGFYRNGLKNGKWTWWNVFGGIDSTGNFRKGLFYGQWKFYHSNGQLKVKGNYRNGEGTNRDEYGLTAHGRHGKWTFWHDNGIQASEITYKEGEIVKWTSWNEQGRKVWEGTLEEYKITEEEAKLKAEEKAAAEKRRIADAARKTEAFKKAEAAKKAEAKKANLSFLEDVHINIYPEYYYSGVMVEMEAIVETDQTPVSISVMLPAEADSVFLIKGIPSPNSEVLPLIINDGEPYKSVDFLIAESQLRLFVFYYPFSDSHNRNLQWPVGSNVAMKNVNIAVQVPTMAEKFSLSVEVDSENRDKNGILFKKVHMGDISANRIKYISVSYLNDTGLTTIENIRKAKEARLEEEARVAEKARKAEEARLAARPSVPIESENEDLTDDLTIEETDLESFEAWDAPPPPPEGPRVKFIPYDYAPRPLTPIRPKYPEVAQEAGIEGTVIVQVFIDRKGRVKETFILKGIPNTGLDEAAIAAIRKTRFEPAIQRERPVGVWISIPVNFRLK